jgi:isochorismate hydrolase
MRKWWKSPILIDNENSALSSDLLIKSGEILIKNYYSAFFKTQLAEKLHDLDISQLVITGVMSHLCCESTAREGFMNNFEIFYVIDGTATYTELLHKGTMFALAHGFAECLTAKDVVGE